MKYFREYLILIMPFIFGISLYLLLFQNPNIWGILDALPLGYSFYWPLAVLAILNLIVIIFIKETWIKRIIYYLIYLALSITIFMALSFYHFGIVMKDY